MTIVRSGVLAVALACALSACHKVSLDETPKTSAPASSPPATVAPGQAVSSAEVASSPIDDPSSPLSKRSLYFDLDSYSVKPEANDILAAHAKYLLADPKRRLLIQGNTDERGTTEYNLALGQKRSEAVAHALETLGVPDSQIEAVSLGKEKPQADGHDETAWAQNRRTDLIYEAR
ncbi:peptidoglycan-associated lipoprotein Pal [Pararobbsia silviterrae]|uniref:Peptidoglycan-associated lipoprotein n=1 Tax=Pararobbsia silviterrae TaxID=1792498 RepID=A0A494XZT4_9BURK|nr:peptidoglycan-associated lipoprotein Pal [Pararobbsia silviterrae]RKP56044.1 peptidoglycan-associated lipoprotein Pal [Pararobbsia silviterrae]